MRMKKQTCVGLYAAAWMESGSNTVDRILVELEAQGLLSYVHMRGYRTGLCLQAELA